MKRSILGKLGALLGAAALTAGLAGCGPFPYSNQTVTALVTSVEGTTVVAELIDDQAQADAAGNPGAPGTAVAYERQGDEVFTVGDESVYQTEAANLHPTTETGTPGALIRLEDGSIAEAPAGVSLADGTLTIADGGTYELSGDFNGTIDATSTEEVRLRLAGLTLTGSDASLIRSAGNLVLELSGENHLTVDGTAEEAEDLPAAVDARGALFLEGDGALTLSAAGRGLSAQTMLSVGGGTLDLTSGDDALFSASDLRIFGGTLRVDAGDDVAHGDLVLVVEGGAVEGTGKEGLESERIYLRDGETTLDTSDDAVNAAEPEAHDDEGAPEGYSEAESCLIAIGGGRLSLNAQGDGIDSNGSLEIRGGEITGSALAPNSGESNAPIDYDGAGVLSGGTLLLTGDGAMAQGFSEADQAYVLARASGSEGQLVSLVAADGQTLASGTAGQAFDVVIATAPGLESGQEVQVTVDGEATAATATTEAQTMAPGGPGAGGQGQGQGGTPPEPPTGRQGTGQDGTTPPEPPSGQPGGNDQNGGTPPKPPSGDQGQGGDRQGTPPEPPSGDQGQGAQDGQAPGSDRQGTTPSEPPTGDAGSQTSATGDEGDTTNQGADGTGTPDAAGAQAGADDGERPTPPTTGEEITFNVTPSEAEQLVAGDIVTVTFGANGEVEHLQVQDAFGGGAPGSAPTSGGSAEDTGTAATTVDGDQTLSDASYKSTTADENTIRVTNGATATLEALDVTKSGDSTNSDASNFYGLNAAVLVNDGAVATVADSTVESDASGANGIFASGTGTRATVSNTKIRTSGDSSGGIMCAGGAILEASNLDIETQGQSSAAIRSDRGGGTMDVTGGTYVTHGTGSPAIYSTADITVGDATLTATGSEGVVVEGKNSVTLENCELSGTMANTYGEGSGENLQTVMIYQSMSGDAEQGEATFDAKGGSIASGAGDLFYMTNTTGTIFLEDVDLTLADGALLRVAGNDGSRGWGQSGSNGGQCTLSATNQQLTGDIVVDEISTLDLRLGEGTTYEGAINADGQAGSVKVLLNGGTWTLTGDSYITSYEGDLSSVAANGHHLFVNGEQVL